MSYSKGIMWLDDCRIPFVDEFIKNTNHKGDKYANFKGSILNEVFYTENNIGRFTPNLLVCDDMLNDGVIRQGNKPSKRNKNHRYSMDYGLKVYEGMDITGYGDIGSSSRYYDLDLWFDKMLEKL